MFRYFHTTAISKNRYLPLITIIIYLYSCNAAQDATEPTLPQVDPLPPPAPATNFLPMFNTGSPYLVLGNGTGDSTFTFASPSSYIQLGPMDIAGYQIRNRRSVSLEFRTRQPHALLVYHGIRNLPANINKYELYVMLDQGQLKVKHLFGDYSTTLVVGKGLNRDKLHKVNVMIDPGEQTILARVDDVENAILIDGLNEHHLYGAENDDLESIIFIGGLKGGDRSLDISYIANPFVGCIQNIKLETTSLKTIPLEPISPLVTSDYHNIKERCVNKCWEPTMKCSRDSKCINHYDHVVCDCFDAKFKGDKCKDTQPSQLTLSGYSYVTFTVYEWMDRVHSDASRISMTFQTSSDDSILFYAAGQLPYHNHIAASIYNNSVCLDIDFKDGEPISTRMGRRVTDGAFHKLTILHHGRNVTIKLDDEVESFNISGKHYHFYIDPDIYIGGGGPILKNRKGLNSSNNFVGCLKEVYLNEKSILFELQETSHQARHHGSTPPIFGQCSPQKTVPITIPFAESGFRVSNPEGRNLTLSFAFKSEEVFGTLAYSEIRTFKGEGFWELKFRYDEIIFELQSDKQIANISHAKNISIKFNRRQGEWNTVDLRCINGEVTLKTDKYNRVEKYPEGLFLSASVILGTSLYKPSTGFVGCIGRVVIGGKPIDARRVVGSEDQIGDIALDNCQFVNPCSRPEVCEHRGKCSVIQGELTCDCSETGYIGKHCHFAIYKRTCEELALLGYTESGVYKIDIDGNGPYPPSHVKCKFETDVYGETKTIVEHNLSNETDVWKPNEENNTDFKLDLKYREFTPEMLLSLVSQSVQCNQHIKFDCYKTKLGLHQYTWFIPADPKAPRVVSIGDAKRSTCPCYEYGKCANKVHCNCDSMGERWLSDEGFFSVSDRLGITQMNFVKPADLPRDAAARITLGPLECVEANTQRYVVTFKTFGSYLEAPGWKSGDLAFSFRTTRSSAILLYQPLLHSQHNSFSVFLTNDHELTFRFILNGGSPQQVTVRSQRSLSGGDWQQVWIDYDLHQVRFQINREHQMINLPDGQQFGPFEGTMYIAGAPANYLEAADAEVVVKDGLIGCFRGLVMNGQVLDLYSYMKFHKADIVKDCSPSCDPNPCKNNAVCQENWGSFTCQCKNPWAHSGTLCETDINTDGLTFLSQSSYIKRQSRDSNPDPIKYILTSDIYLNLRTYDSSALVLYANDNLNNFVQLHIESGTKVIFTWNERDNIRHIFVSYKNLNHGHSIQVAVVRNATHTSLHVNRDNVTVEIGVSLLTQYSEKPWFNNELEMFSPPRPFAPVSSYYQLLLGGFDNLALKPVSNLTDIPGMLGCLRGLKIGNNRLPISEFTNYNDVLEGCKMVCDSIPCKNGGICLEDFQARTHSCDCTFTSYYGQSCTEERGASFQGESCIRRRFKNPLENVQQIEARFGFSATYAEEESTVLLTVQIPGQGYSLLFSVNKDGHLVLHEKDGSAEIEETIAYQNFVDGFRHSLFYKREEQEIIFMVDQEEIPVKQLTSKFGSFSLASASYAEDVRNIGEVFIGGVNTPTSNLAKFRKFKGCMSNIIVTLNSVEMRPLGEYMGFVRKDPDLVLDVEKIEGIKLGNCAAFSLLPTAIVVPITNGMQPPTEGSDWRTADGFAKRVRLDRRKTEVVEKSAISFDTMALIFAIFFAILIISVGMYTYRLNKRYKRRYLEDNDDDDLYFAHRGQTIRYQDPSSTELKYVGYKAQDPDKMVLLNNENNARKELGQQSPGENEEEEELKKIDEDNASSDTSSQKSGSQGHSSASSLSDTQNIDDKGVQDFELGGEIVKCPRIEETTETELTEDDDGLDDRENMDDDDDLLNFELLPVNPNAPPSPVYVSDTVRTFESSPLAKIGGAKYQQFKRTSKDSILSLD